MRGIKRLAGSCPRVMFLGWNYSTCGSELSYSSHGDSLSLSLSLSRTFPTLIDKPSEQTELIHQIISTTAINAQDLCADGSGFRKKEG